MGICFLEDSKIFKLDSLTSTYMIGIVDQENFLGHIYYGKKVSDQDLTYLLRIDEPPFVPSVNNRDRGSFLDSFPMEYSTSGTGDYREGCLEIETENGSAAISLTYKRHTIYKGKKVLEGLPATFGKEEECTSLEIVCEDPVYQVEVILSYTVYENLDAITRNVKIVNHGQKSIALRKVMSVCIDFEGLDYDVMTLHGSWARERHIQRNRLGYGKFATSSVRGESSHQDHPFLALLNHKADEDYGEVYGFNFVYSGNFIAQAEGCQFDTVRVIMGINPLNFKWKLENEAAFQAPEVVMVYSDQGIGKMTRTFHDLYRQHLIRGKYKDSERPVLINNWEATYFDFDTQKLLDIAKEASSLGIEMLVMDDGWFGKRSSDNCALGDWIVNEEKIKGGLKNLVDQVNGYGMKFGIWFEPEMISPDSDLYRKHPDWAIQIPGKEPTLSRNQYVLDFSRVEIRDYIFELMKDVLTSANITYVKWDMNRQLTDLASSRLPADQQGELSHRYVLGVYDLMNRLTKEFPDLLLENCSGGGARFDPGMLYYSPQIWCSDDTDAIERLRIQQGTSMIYPLSCMGAHVSDCPNHTVGRVTPFETRGYVALAGTFGYELDVTKIPQEDRDLIPGQIEMYHKYNSLIRRGDYYRIASYGDNCNYDCWQVTAKDKSEALVTFIQVMGRPNWHSTRIKLKGLDEDAVYELEGTKITLSGAAFMYAGINIKDLYGDYQGRLLHLIRK